MPESMAPSSRPPPTSGGAIYVILAVALVAAIIGLVYWKLRGETPTAVPRPVATTPATLAEPPPPPPPIEESAPVLDSGARVATTAYNPCAVPKCGGSSNNAMASALSARAGSARPCYERALRVNSNLQGKLMLTVRVDPQGNVCSAAITQDAIHSPEVSNCVTGMFRSAKFPPPTGGCIDVNLPLSFAPKEGK
jgi:outer membrane biosynthesis protein TonB